MNNTTKVIQHLTTFGDQQSHSILLYILVDNHTTPYTALHTHPRRLRGRNRGLPRSPRTPLALPHSLPKPSPSLSSPALTY